MITITPNYNKMAMKFSVPGTGWNSIIVHADNLAEVHAAIDHYHAQPHNHDQCPLCRIKDTLIG